MSTGWFSISRDLLDNDLWRSEKFTRGQAWVDLIGRAKHKEGYFYHRGIKVDYQRGTVTEGEKKLSEIWKWSRSKTRKFLKDLEKEQQIEQQKSRVITLIKLINYNKYQEKVQQTEQQKNNKKTTERQQKDTHNNVNNGNNGNKNTPLPPTRGKFVPPTIEEVETYFREKAKEKNVKFNYKAKAEVFINHYTSNGWKVGRNKMKDWKAAINSQWMPKIIDDYKKTSVPYHKN